MLESDNKSITHQKPSRLLGNMLCVSGILKKIGIHLRYDSKNIFMDSESQLLTDEIVDGANSK